MSDGKANAKRKEPETQIMLCTCDHTYQDAKYGKGKRVFNARLKDHKLLGWRCTVCGKTTTV